MLESIDTGIDSIVHSEIIVAMVLISEGRQGLVNSVMKCGRLRHGMASERSVLWW